MKYMCRTIYYHFSISISKTVLLKETLKCTTKQLSPMKNFQMLMYWPTINKKKIKTTLVHPFTFGHHNLLILSHFFST